jgi:hypothetical protein
MESEVRAPDLIERAVALLGGIRLSDPEAAVMLPWVLAHSRELGLDDEPEQREPAMASAGG